MPYLLSAAEDAHQTGSPLMRPMFLEFPDDPACAHLDRQYMLGSELLVAPVMGSGGSVDFYLPEGTWTHLESGEELSGPRWHSKAFSVVEAALYVRPGAILPIGTVSDRPEYDWANELEFKAFAAVEGHRRTVTVPQADGGFARFEVAVEGGRPVAVAHPAEVKVDK
jgi:alpha-D-xyloside xylohydrolase